jgi:hypothetical protein
MINARTREVGELRGSNLARFGRNQRRAFLVAPRAGEAFGVRRFRSWDDVRQWQQQRRQRS